MESVLMRLKAKSGDVLFPSRGLKYGNTVKINQTTLVKLKELGVVFHPDCQEKITTGVIPDEVDVNVSGLLSEGSQIYPIYVIDQNDHLVGFWKNGCWFDDESCDMAYVQQWYDDELEFDPRPILLA